MRSCRPCSSRHRLIKPGDLSLAHRGRGDHRSGGAALRRTSRLIPEASGGIMTADDDNAVLAATVRTLRGRSVGCRQDIGDVAGRAAFAVAVRIRHFLTRIVQRAMDLQSAVVAMTGHVDNMSKAAVRAFAVATSGAVAAVASAGVRNDGRGVVVAFIAVAAIAFRIRGAANPAARIPIRSPAGIAAARSVRLEVVGAGFIVADMLTVVMVRTGPVAAPAATAA